MGTLEKQNKAWEVGKEFVGELQVSPWDALLSEVRRSAYRTAWVDARVEMARKRVDEAADFEEENVITLRDQELRQWIRTSQDERKHMTQVAKNAIQAGLAERYVESVRVEGQRIAGIISRSIEAGNLSQEQQDAIKGQLMLELGDMSREMRSRAEVVNLPSIEA